MTLYTSGYTIQWEYLVDLNIIDFMIPMYWWVLIVLIKLTETKPAHNNSAIGK